MGENDFTEGFYGPDQRRELKTELLSYRQNGIYLSVEGVPRLPDDEMVELILGEDECTYMRDYRFKGGEIVGINFNRIRLM